MNEIAQVTKLAAEMCVAQIEIYLFQILCLNFNDFYSTAGQFWMI